MTQMYLYLLSFPELFWNCIFLYLPSWTNLDSSKASDLDFIPVVVLKNCKHELSFVLLKLFSMCCHKEVFFPDCWKFSYMVPLFKNVGKVTLFSLLSLASKSFESLKIIQCLINAAFSLLASMASKHLYLRELLGFQKGLVLLQHLISKAFDRIWNMGLLHRLNPCGISDQVFSLNSDFVVIDGFRWFWMGILCNNIQLMLVFLRFHTWSYTFLNTHSWHFLMMLSVILPYLLMILAFLWAVYFVNLH